jgi:hypothetical protein
MTIESPSVPVWRVRQLVELAYDLVAEADDIVVAEPPVDDASLLELWQSTRELAADWQRRLQRLDRHREASWSRTWCDDLVRMGHEIFAAEVLFRVWGTMLAAQDRQRDTAAARPILDHVVFNVQHVRSKTMELVMHAGDPAATVDRFRRRCERWTDVLIGPLVARYGTAIYAHEARRAWEFGEELLSAELVAGAEQLRRAGFRTAFRDGALAAAATPGWQSVIDAVLDGCPTAVQENLMHWRSAGMTDEAMHESTDQPVESDGWTLLARCLRVAELRHESEQ